MRARTLASCGIVVLVGFVVWDRIQVRNKIRALEHSNQTLREAESERAARPAWPQLILPVPLTTTTAQAANAKAESPGSDKPPATPPASAEDNFAHLETMFRQEVSDREWSGEARHRLEQRLLPLAKEPQNLSLECRST